MLGPGGYIPLGKIFATKSFDVATDCVLYFGCAVQDTLCRRKSNFLTKLKYTTSRLSNLLYQAVQKVASDELAELKNLRRNTLFRKCASCFLSASLYFSKRGAY